MDAQPPAPQPGAAASTAAATEPAMLQRCLAIAEARLLDERRLCDEFMAVREQDRLIEHTSQVAMRQASRNRYSNVHPYDHNRVHLGSGMDYINASHIVQPDLSGSQLRYIAAQGPTPNTIEDFWRMVLEQRAAAVIMVTNLVENRMTKCALYYPENAGDSLTAGRLLVRTVKVTAASTALTVRQVQVVGAGPPWDVYHFHYQAWPDHGTPHESTPIWQISHALDELRGPAGQQPVVVHCSAGIGRTGTFCALDVLRHRLDALQQQRRIPTSAALQPAAAATSSGPAAAVTTSGRAGAAASGGAATLTVGEDVGALLDVPALVHELRQQRGGMVQSQEQYVFIYQALVDELRKRCQAPNANGHGT